MNRLLLKTTLRKKTESSEGFTLLEVMLSFLLLSLIAGSVLVIYTGILSGTKKAAVHQGALNTLEILAEAASERVKNTWPDSVGVLRESGEKIEGYIYSVDDYGFVENPLETGVINVKHIRVTVYFTVTSAEGKEVERHYNTSLLIGN